MGVDVATLYKTRRRAVLAIVRRTGVARRWREDVTQSVFLAVVERAGDLDPERVDGWIRVVARRQARDQMELGSTREHPLPHGALDRPSVVPDPEQALLDAEREAVVERLCAGLDPVLERVDLLGQSSPAVAAELGIPISTVEGRLRRARAKLQARIARLRLEVRT